MWLWRWVVQGHSAVSNVCPDDVDFPVSIYVKTLINNVLPYTTQNSLCI